MKYPKLEGICRKCYGCEQLQIETFKGKQRCKDFVRGVRDDLFIRDKEKTSKLQ